MLGAGWLGICFSGEMAHVTTEAEHGVADITGRLGRQNPGMYSGG